MMRSVIRPAATAIVAMVVALVAGCGGGGGGASGQDMTAGLSPTELLSRSAGAARALTSFRIAVDATGRIDLSPSASFPGASLLSGPLAISGEGPVQPPDRASIDARLDLGSFSPQVNLTRVGDEVFVGLLGQDFRLALAPEQVALLDLDSLYPTLAGWMTTPKEAGREDVDGASTVKLTGGIDAGAAFADLSPLLQSATGQAVLVPTRRLKAAVKEGTAEVWIGTEDLRPRRVHIVLKADGTGIVDGVGALAIDLTATLSAFDEPVDIRAPRNPRDLDLNQLGSLTGG